MELWNYSFAIMIKVKLVTYQVIDVWNFLQSKKK